MKTTFFGLAVLLSQTFCVSMQAAHGTDAAHTTLSVPGDYSTIQAAIDASEIFGNPIIQIGPGDYYEQLLISNKVRLTLTGDPGTVLHATTDLSQMLRPRTQLKPVIAILNSHVDLAGLTIDGDRLGGAFPGEEALQGLFFLGSGGSVENCTIRGFRGDTLDAYSSARALIVWNPKSARPEGIEVSIIGNTFADNEASITLAGDDQFYPTELRTSFTIEKNIITGFGPAAIPVDGVVVYTGAGGVFRGNTITDHQYTGEGDPYSSGIDAFDGFGDKRNPARLIPLKPIRFEGNTFRNNSDHVVLINAFNSEVVNNIFQGAGPNGSRWGALSISGADIRVANNNFANSATGIFLFGNDHFFDGWPSVDKAADVQLSSNWFSNVAQRVRTHPLVTGVKEEGTQLPPFQPRFISIASSKSSNLQHSASISMHLRCWHNRPLVIETSSDFRNWTSVYHSDAPLPLFEYIEANPGVSPRFYRCFNK